MPCFFYYKNVFKLDFLGFMYLNPEDRLCVNPDIIKAFRYKNFKPF